VLNAPTRKNVVLVCGSDRILLHCRVRVLERAGFEIEIARSSAEAAVAVELKQFQLVVLCHTLSAATRETIQLLCWRFGIPTFEIPVLLPPEKLVETVAGRTAADVSRREPRAG
jgi:hypothetical protein